MKKRRFTLIILTLLAWFVPTACTTVIPPEPGDDGGPKPTDLRQHVMEVLKPNSLLRMNWFSEIGEVDENTRMVMSDVMPTQTYLRGAFKTRTYNAWMYCVTMVNPPAKAGGKARVGVMTIYVRNGEGSFGRNNCLWYDPTEDYKNAAKRAIAEVSHKNGYQ